MSRDRSDWQSSKSRPATQLDIALIYASKGWSIVPVKFRDKTKHPVILWEYYQKHYPTQEELDIWFGAGLKGRELNSDLLSRWFKVCPTAEQLKRMFPPNPKRNIAIITGKLSGVLVVECDSQAAIELYAKLGGDINGPCVRSQRGTHFYLRWPKGKDLSAEKWPRNFQGKESFPELDFRGEGGCIIAPNSTHWTGHVYTWRNVNHQLQPDDLPVVPNSIIEAAFRQGSYTKPDGKKERGRTFAEMYQETPPGARNKTVATLAGKWVKDTSVEMALELGRAWWNYHRPNWEALDAPPFPLEEVEAIIRSIYAREQKRKTAAQQDRAGENVLSVNNQDGSELRIEYGQRKGSGKLDIVAKLADRTVHADKIDIASVKERDRFAKELCKQLPSVDERVVQDKLLELAGESTTKGRPQSPDSATGSSNDISHAYEATPNGIVWNRPVHDSTVTVLLSNFTAEIKTELQRDDGVEIQQIFEIEARLKGRDRAFLVAATKFASMNWVLEQLGASAILSPGFGMKEHARAAIQHLSNPTTRKVYAHTGFRKICDQWLYLHAGGAIGAEGKVEGIEVSLPEDLANFILPDPPSGDTLVKAIRASLSMIEVGPDEVTLPFFCALWRAPLGPCDFSLHATGDTGYFKSELVALGQQHFGPAMDRLHLPASWSSTENALEAIAFGAKDAALTIDDFAPRGTPNDIQRWHQKADRIFRAQGNSSGRQRMRSDGSLRPSKPPRGLILSTGEAIPQGQSCKARLLVIGIGPRDINPDKLLPCQRDASDGLYAQTMAGYVKSLAGRYEEIRKTLRGEIIDVRQQADISGVHRRTPEIIANLVVGLKYFLLFAQEMGGITAHDAFALMEHARKVLGTVAQRQAASLQESDATERFLELVSSAISSGHAHLANKDGGIPEKARAWGWRSVLVGTGVHVREEMRPQGIQVGWLDKSHVYLDRDSSFKVAQQMASSGEQIAVDSKTLVQRLYEKGLIHREPKRDVNYVRRVLQGKSREVIFLRDDCLNTPEPAIPDNPASCVDSKEENPGSDVRFSSPGPSNLTPEPDNTREMESDDVTGGQKGQFAESDQTDDPDSETAAVSEDREKVIL